METTGSVRGFAGAAVAAGAVLWLGIGAAGYAQAQDVRGYPEHVPYSYDAREIAMLPRYCIYTQLYRENVPGGDNKQEVDRWYALMGPTFHHVHHYCYGLTYTNRAKFLARDQQMRMFYLQSSIREFDYVLERATKDFLLLPEIHARKGANLLQLGLPTLGLEQLERALEIKPDYWPAYAYLGDYYVEQGAPERAREVLKKGLSMSPEAKGLKRRLAELDAGGATPKGASRSSRRSEAD